MSKDFPIVQVKNLPYNTSTSAIYELASPYGSINQVRVPSGNANAGTCIIVYNNMVSATRASNEINGVNYRGRYLVAHLYTVDRLKLMHEDYIHRKEHLETLKRRYELTGEEQH